MPGAGLSERLYRSLNVWIGRLPGGMLHTNIMACGVFSAVAGSSVATAATMGSVALPYFEKSHYPPKLVLGSLAAGGALGNLIPPGSLQSGPDAPVGSGRADRRDRAA